MKSNFMSRLLIMLMVGAMFMAYSPVIHAQSQLNSSGCHNDFRSQIAGTTSNLDFEAMCETYETCLSGGISECLLPVFESVMIPCEGVDSCENEALLYTVMIDFFNHPNLADELTLDMLPLDDTVIALEYIQAQDYESAFAIYEQMTTTYDHPSVTLMMGYVYSLMGDPELAIEQYNLALTQNSNDPMLYFLRSREYAALDQLDLALIDLHIVYDMFSQAHVPELEALLAGFLDELPLNMMLEEEAWTLYPTVYRTDNTGTETVVDTSSNDPFDVLIYPIDDQTLLLTEMPVRGEYIIASSIVYVTLNDEGQYVAELNKFQASHTSNVILTGDRELGRFDGVIEYLSTWETSAIEFILLPAGEPDPRN